MSDNKDEKYRNGTGHEDITDCDRAAGAVDGVPAHNVIVLKP